MTIWPHACVAALVNFALHAHTVGLPDEVREALAPDLPDTLDAVCIQRGTTHDPTSKWIADPSSILAADKDTTSQSWWTEKVGKRRRDELERQGTLGIKSVSPHSRVPWPRPGLLQSRLVP